MGSPFYNKNIGPNIRRLRLYSGIKQQDCAKALGVSRQMLSHYENNKYYVPEFVVDKALSFLNIKISMLLINSSSLTDY